MEYENRYASKGVAGTALGLGAGALGVELLRGGLGGILGGNCNSGCGNGCSENMIVNRYELGQESRISELQSQIALRDANTYGDQKMLELYKYFDGKLGEINSALCQQAVHNQKTEDSFTLASHDLACAKRELMDQIKLEAERRCCGDNSIITYLNATFYPKLVADVTAGTTTTAQTLYNPLPDCGCCGGR